MQRSVRPLRRPGRRRLFTPRKASLLAAGVVVAAIGAAGLNAPATAAPSAAGGLGPRLDHHRGRR